MAEDETGPPLPSLESAVKKFGLRPRDKAKRLSRASVKQQKVGAFWFASGENISGGDNQLCDTETGREMELERFLNKKSGYVVQYTFVYIYCKLRSPKHRHQSYLLAKINNCT